MPATPEAEPPWKRKLKTVWRRANRSDLCNRNEASTANGNAPQVAPHTAVTSESTPLLRRLPLSRQNSNWNPTPREARQVRFRLLLTMCLAFTLVAALGNVMLDIASVRLLEMSLCRDYYRKHHPSYVGPPPLSYVREGLCKVKEIETSLLDLRVLKGVIMILPALIASIPYGIQADKIGRKPILYLSLVGQIFSFLCIFIVCFFHETFDVKWVLFSSLFLLIGGGYPMSTAVISMIIVDITPEDTRIICFYSVGAAVTIANLLAFPLESWLLPQDMWLQYIVSFFVLFTAWLIAFVIPETRKPKRHTENSLHATGHSYKTYLPWAKDLFMQTKENLIGFGRNHNLMVCLGIICLNAFGRPALTLFSRFAYLFLRLPNFMIGQLEAMRMGVALAISISLALATPYLKVKFSPISSLFDVWTTRVCFVLLAIGTVVVGTSTGLAGMRAGYIIAALGSPVYQAMQGIIVSFVGPANFGILYSGIAAAELVMELAGGSIFVATFEGATDEYNRRLLGIPIAMSALVYLGAMALTSAFDVPQLSGELDDDDDDDDDD